MKWRCHLEDRGPLCLLADVIPGTEGACGWGDACRVLEPMDSCHHPTTMAARLGQPLGWRVRPRCPLSPARPAAKEEVAAIPCPLKRLELRGGYWGEGHLGQSPPLTKPPGHTRQQTGLWTSMPFMELPRSALPDNPFKYSGPLPFVF